MKIGITKDGDGFVLALDAARVRLGEADMRTLLVQVTQALVPGADLGLSAEARAREFMERLKRANGPGIQTLLRVAAEDDILVLLKAGEGDRAFLDKLYGNMSDKSRRMFAEDLAFKFPDSVTQPDVAKAVGRLMRIVDELEKKGSLSFG